MKLHKAQNEEKRTSSNIKSAMITKLLENGNGKYLNGQNYYFYDSDLNLIWKQVPVFFYVPFLGDAKDDGNFIKIIQKCFNFMDCQPVFVENVGSYISSHATHNQKQKTNGNIKMLKLYYVSDNTEKISPIFKLSRLNRNILRQSLQNVIHITENSLVNTSQPCKQIISYRKSVQLQKALESIALLTCRSLILSHNNNPNIIRPFSNILFPYLTSLYLTHNNLLSLDPLLCLSLPKLSILYLNNNCIVNLKHLPRLVNNLSSITQLVLFDNYFVSFCDGEGRNFMAKAHLSKLLTLKIQMFKTSSVRGESLNWLLKLETGQADSLEDMKQFNDLNMGIQEQPMPYDNNFKLLYIESKKRIGRHTEIISKKMKKKHEKVKIKSNIVVPIVQRHNQYGFF